MRTCRAGGSPGTATRPDVPYTLVIVRIEWEIVAAISEAIGAIAVVISLIYLAFQVRQNTRAIKGATLGAITSQQKDELRWSAEMPHIWKKAIEAPGSLTFEESFQLGEWTTAAFTARQNEFHQYRNGLLDREIWLGSENIIRLLVGLEWIRNWWQEHGRNDRSAEFVELVDRLISKNTRDVVSELDKALIHQQEKAGNPD